MSEEAENSGGGSLKSILIGLLSTVTVAVGGFVTKQLVGEETKDEPAQATSAPAPVINITNSNQQAQQASGGGVKVIERVVEKPSGSAKPAPAPKPKKKEGDEFKEEAPKW